MIFDEITLENGLRIIGERIDHFRSVSVGIWIGAGSQYETRAQGGVSHLIEHMLFKGSEKRSARQIAEVMDAVGGQMNAFTAKECTCFYAKVVDEHLPLALDVLSDLVLHPLFDEKELEKEKGVVCEEIAMAEDSPEDLVSELLMLAQFGDQPIARPILGTTETVTSFTRAALNEYYQKMYRPENAVLAVAGHYDWDALVDMARENLGGWAPGGAPQIFRSVTAEPQVLRREKDIEQLHICLGYPGVEQNSDRIYPLSIFNSVLGGAMSSHLFQRIREERGLVYTIYSYPSSYRDCGLLTIYAGTSLENAPEVLRLIREESRAMIEKGLTQDEFDKAREQLKGGYILGLESTSSRMNAIGRRKLILGNTQTETEAIDKINAVTYDQVMEVARAVLSAPCSAALVGKGAAELQV